MRTMTAANLCLTGFMFLSGSRVCCWRALQKKINSGVLVLCEENDFSQGLIEYLNHAGYKVFVVFPGKSFAPAKENSYVLNLGCRSQYKELVTEITRDGNQLDYIINCFGLAAEDNSRQRAAGDINETYFWLLCI